MAQAPCSGSWTFSGDIRAYSIQIAPQERYSDRKSIELASRRLLFWHPLCLLSWMDKFLYLLGEFSLLVRVLFLRRILRHHPRWAGKSAANDQSCPPSAGNEGVASTNAGVSPCLVSAISMVPPDWNSLITLMAWFCGTDQIRRRRDHCGMQGCSGTTAWWRREGGQDFEDVFSASQLGSSRGHFVLTRVLVASRLSAFYCGVGMVRGRHAGAIVSLPFSWALMKGNVFLMSPSQRALPFG